MHQKNQHTFLNGLANVQNINADKLNVSSVTGMFAMFDGCSNLTQLDVSNWNTSNVTNMGAMFHSCISLTSIGDLSNWDVSKVTNMWAMFYNCSSLTQLDVSKWNVSNVTETHQMFSGCRSLTQLDLSNWDTTNVANMNSMFYGCSNLTSIGDLSGWNVSKVTNMFNMFYGCSSLTDIGGLSGWDVSKVTNISGMFYECTSLTEINLSNWNIAKVVDATNIFTNCNKLEEIYTPKVLPEDNTAIILPRAYRDINKPEENTSYTSIQKSNNKFSQSIHLVDGISVTFDVDFAKNYFKNEYTDSIKPRFYKKSEVLQFGDSQETGEKLLPSTTADGKAILWDEEALENETGYEFLGWECSYDYKYYDVPFVANYFAENIVYTAIFKDTSIVTYDIELTNICKETGKLLPNAQYSVTGTGRDNITQIEYATNENGILKIENLYAYEEYTLTEKRAADGYKIRENPVKFRMVMKNNKWEFEVIEGSLKISTVEESTGEAVNTQVRVNWEDEILFKVRKVDSENEQLGLQGAKFTVKYKNTKDSSLEYAKNINGELIGKQETINGEQMYVVTTDENGYIFEEVIPGEYEVTEVSPPEGYKIPENPVQKLNIKLTQNEKLIATESWALRFATSAADQIERVILTKDGGRIFVGKIGATDNAESGQILPTGGDAVMIKYNAKGQRVWGAVSEHGYPNIIVETEDKGFLIACVNGIEKYKRNGEGYEKEWESGIVTDSNGFVISYAAGTSDDGLVVGCKLNSNSKKTLENGTPEYRDITTTTNNAIVLIKYKKVEDGNYVVEWTNQIETSKDGNITAMTETSDGGILFGGNVRGDLILSKNNTLDKGTNGTDQNNIFLVKYKKKENGDPGYDYSWARRVTGTSLSMLTGITETTDKKYAIVGFFQGTINIPVTNDTLDSNGSRDILVMVFDEKGNILEKSNIGGSGSEQLNHVARMNDGGFVAVGSIASNNITLKTVNNEQITIPHVKNDNSGDDDASQRDALVIRYDKNMNIVWAKSYGGKRQDHFSSVYIDEDNNILLGTYFISMAIKLENDKLLNDGIIRGSSYDETKSYNDQKERNDNTDTDGAMIQLKEYVDTPQKLDTQAITVLGEKIPEVELEIVKKWDNINNKYVKPASVTIELTTNIAGVEEKEEITLTKDNKTEIEGEPEGQETWSYKITKPQCTKNDEKIVYTIKEKSYTLE